MDPSLTNWGLAEGTLDLNSGFLSELGLSIVEPERLKGKQVRQNSKDLYEAEQLANIAVKAAMRAKAVFVEVPIGSQSARAMASYGVCVGILGAIRAAGIPLIEVTPTEVKMAFTGNKNATKQMMIDEALRLYPDANFPRWRGEISSKAEHVADAIAAIHAGANTPTFQNLMRLFRKVA